jgi:hypothetical protein
MSLIVLEALARGRFVAWKYAIPGVRQVRTPDDTFHHLSELHARHAVGQLGLNLEGFSYISAAYEEHQVSVGVEHFFETTVQAASRRISSSRQIAISGLDVFAADVADANNNLGTDWDAQVLQFDTKYDIASSLYRLARCNVWYTVGTPSVGRSLQVVADLFRKPRVMHWVGTDIEVARRNPKILDGLRGSSVTHLTEVEWEADDLRALGIRAEIAPLPPRFSCEDSVPPLPTDFTLLTYLPPSRTEFYGSKELEIIIRVFRDRPIKFLIVGGTKIDTPPGVALENLGWCYSLNDIYSRSSVLLRFTPRDGLSLMVLEALAFGLHILWTKSFPFVKQVTSVEAIIEALNQLLDLHQKGELKPQSDAVQFVRTMYDRKRCIDRIAAASSKAIPQTKNARRPK